MSHGECNLDVMLSTLRPELQKHPYVFGSLSTTELILTDQLHPVATMQEAEGLSVIVTQDEAERHNIPFEEAFRQITLTVHSSLSSVGLTAAISTRLAQHKIPANIVAGAFHDHLFVPASLANKAMNVLESLSNESEHLLHDEKTSDTQQP